MVSLDIIENCFPCFQNSVKNNILDYFSRDENEYITYCELKKSMENTVYILSSILYVPIMISYFPTILCQEDKIKSLNRATDKKVKCISLKTQINGICNTG